MSDPLTGIATVRLYQLPKVLGICTKTIKNLRKRGKFPPAIRLDERSLGFRVEDIKRWQKERETA